MTFLISCSAATGHSAISSCAPGSQGNACNCAHVPLTLSCTPSLRLPLPSSTPTFALACRRSPSVEGRVEPYRLQRTAAQSRCSLSVVTIVHHWEGVNWWSIHLYCYLGTPWTSIFHSGRSRRPRAVTPVCLPLLHSKNILSHNPQSPGAQCPVSQQNGIGDLCSM